jgi:hypothetical protein
MGEQNGATLARTEPMLSGAGRTITVENNSHEVMEAERARASRAAARRCRSRATMPDPKRLPDATTE